MPRVSAEARAGAAWRAGGTYPRAPVCLDLEAKKVWKEIVETRPVDWFAPGNLHLLETFCQVTVAQRRNLELLAERPTDPDVIAAVKALATVLNQTAMKLRISVQAHIKNTSSKLDEQRSRSSVERMAPPIWPDEQKRRIN